MNDVSRKDPQATRIDDNVIDHPHRSIQMNMNARQHFGFLIIFALVVGVASYMFLVRVDEGSHTLAAKYAARGYPTSPMSDLVKRQLPINNQYAEAGELMMGCPGGDNMPYPLTCQFAKQAPVLYRRDLSASVTSANVVPAATWNSYIRAYSKKQIEQAHKKHATGSELAWQRIYDATRGPNEKPVAHVTPAETVCPIDQTLLGYGNCMNQKWATVLGLTIPDSRPWFEQHGINPIAFILALVISTFVTALYWLGNTRATIGGILYWVVPPFVRHKYFKFGVMAIIVIIIVLNVFQK